MKKLWLAAVMAISVSASATEVDKVIDQGNAEKIGNSTLGAVGSNSNNNGVSGSFNNSSTTTINGNTGTTVNNKSHKPQGYVNGVPLVTSPGTCMGSIGGSVSGAAIGISGGKTYIDQHCNQRANETNRINNLNAKAAMLQKLGLDTAAVAILCQGDADYAAAIRKVMNAEKFIEVCTR